MPTCNRCRQDIGFFGSLSFNKQTNRCAKCEQATHQALDRFRQNFLHATYSQLLSEESWQSLSRSAESDALNLSEALNFISGDALHFLERSIIFFYADGEITDEEDSYIKTLIQVLQIPPQHAHSLVQRLDYLKGLTRIRRGQLPIVQPRFHLESGETCHLDMGATYKVYATSFKQVLGRLVATNKKLHFLSPSGGFVIQWKRIMRIERDGNGIYLELSTKKGNGYYEVHDPMLAEAVLMTLTRISKRELVGVQEDVATRHIPQDVKIAVWQRDQGKCVQCASASYLEFDHIIPFSKGGANTVKNVQLLCRKCNLAKGGRL
jgi:hypothetical protein